MDPAEPEPEPPPEPELPPEPALDADPPDLDPDPEPGIDPMLATSVVPNASEPVPAVLGPRGSEPSGRFVLPVQFGSRDPVVVRWSVPRRVSSIAPRVVPSDDCS
jgi:hypothetical protein